jgi:hypothetical protein
MMTRYLVMAATLAALALPAFGETGQAMSANVVADRAAGGRGWVDATELARLLVEKGMISHGEQKTLTRPLGARAIDDNALEEIFESESYRGE